MENVGLAVLVMVAFVAAIMIFYLLGHKFGWQEGYRQAQKEFGKLVDEMRQSEKEVEEEVQALKKQVGGIEKLARDLDDGK
jgi:glucosamine 6-phosphate synthetase-like amidotransferase/phosphosugar isomerase protein